MASYQGHLKFAAVLGAAYGAAGVYLWGLDWGPVFLAAGLTTVGGLLPDLDSDSGVPVREMFTLAAVVLPLLLMKRLLALVRDGDLTAEQLVVLAAGLYVLIRFGVSRAFKRLSVHRGMFHSIPALLIAGLAAFLVYPDDHKPIRLYMAGAVMLGFLSHLVLDEIYAVDFMGVTVRLNRSAGSALKLWSRSLVATTATYLLLVALAGMAYAEWHSVNWEGEQRGAVRSAKSPPLPPPPPPR